MSAHGFPVVSNGQVPRHSENPIQYLLQTAVNPPVAEAAQLPVVSNFREGHPLRPEEILNRLLQATQGWPHRIGKSLFASSTDKRTIWCEEPNAFYAWLKSQARVKWSRKNGAVTQAEFFAYLNQHAPDRRWLYELPHEPPLPQMDYVHPQVPPGNGQHLEQLLSMYTPDSPVDRDLLRSFILTLFWGGIPGQRPAFMFVGPQHETDPTQNRRASGKSTLVNTLGELCGGIISVSMKDDMAAVKKRLLSTGATQLRIVLVDNVHAMRLTSAEIEAEITASSISGHKLFKGESQRPNTLVWCFTMNGGMLAKDMAQRCIIIRLGRPTLAGNWVEQVYNYIAEHKWQILGDIVARLRSAAPQFPSTIRWAHWEAEVLSRSGNLVAMQHAIRQRQTELDDDQAKVDNIRAMVAERIRSAGFDPERKIVFIPSETLAGWIQIETGLRLGGEKLGNYLRTLGLQEFQTHRFSHVRGWLRLCSNHDGSPICHVVH